MGGIAALYIAAAYAAAIPYFLIVVDYPSVVDPAEKLALLREHYGSMYAMHFVVYELVGIALVVLSLALHDRLQAGARVLARLSTVLGLLWAGTLLASSMVFNYGMGEVIKLYDVSPDQAIWTWQVIEAVAQGVGGAGGELLGGLWMLSVSAAAWHARALPRAAIVLGLVIAAVGLASKVPPVHSLGVVFGVLQIVWFSSIGALLLRRSSWSDPDRELPEAASR
jgi:hypothetical protein